MRQWDEIILWRQSLQHATDEEVHAELQARFGSRTSFVDRELVRTVQFFAEKPRGMTEAEVGAQIDVLHDANP